MLEYLKAHFASDNSWDEEFIKLVTQEKPGIRSFYIISQTPHNVNEYSYPHLTGNNTSYKKLIILSKQRSGSTYLSNLLQHHSNIACYGELFLPHQCFFNYPFFPKPDNRELLKWRNSSIKKFLHHFVYRNYMDNISAVGFKIFYNQGTPLQFPGVWKILKDYPDLHIIHLVRKNHLRSFISLKQAIKTNVWVIDSSTIGKREDHEPDGFFLKNKNQNTMKDTAVLKLNFREMRAYFQKSDDNISRFNHFFPNHSFLEIYYEDFKYDPNQTIREISAFLGVPEKKLFSPFVRQHPQKMSYMVSNYSELKIKFSKTKWAIFFDE